MDQWTLGVVSSYHMIGQQPWLTIRSDNGTCKLDLRRPSNAIQVDWVKYAIQTRAGTDAAALNAEQLRDQFDEVTELGSKCRAKVPTEVTKLLPTPFDPDGEVPIIRPDYLAILSARRQHGFKWDMNKKSKRAYECSICPSNR
ncbi:hypothetical protein JG687_00006664 [Phytophthora cactorum]|uniref:Uncharacterized protein n=1 Tax=Phytophthora cactorum TaxID=29920 RepID=A0A8T1UMD4_9STRA|nr:hypothetical protein PC128_g8998 [Phytophthora cactorum]KAG6963286.1 hypothetical protein JG687_00006664 [Phytophthora cactorum]